MEPEPAVINTAIPKVGVTETKGLPEKPEEKKQVDESLLVVEELLCMLRAQSHLPTPWRRYVGERKKKFEEYTSRLVWFVDEEYLCITGKEGVKSKRSDIAYMLLAMTSPVFFDEVKSSKCIVALLIDGSVMLSTSDGRHFWNGKRVLNTSQSGQRFFYHFSDGKTTKRSTKEFDEVMKGAKVVMMAYDTQLNDYMCKYRHIVGGLKWESQPHQMKQYANMRKVPSPPSLPMSQVISKDLSTTLKATADKNGATAH